jgi:hypothetical protein
MLNYLTGLLRRAGKEPVPVRYLSKAEGDGTWYEAQLWAVDAQGVTFRRANGHQQIADCLPWGSVAAIEIALDQDTLVSS